MTHKITGGGGERVVVVVDVDVVVVVKSKLVNEVRISDQMVRGGAGTFISSMESALEYRHIYAFIHIHS